MRILLIVVFVTGCGFNLDGLRGAERDAGDAGSDSEGDACVGIDALQPSVLSRGVDAFVPGDSSIEALPVAQTVQDALPLDTVSVDGIVVDGAVVDGVKVEVLGDAEATCACIQRVIDHGYATDYPAGHPAKRACSTNQCREALDCLAHQPVCDLACFRACIGTPYDHNVISDVLDLFTSSCGAQPWAANEIWTCKKALQ